MKTTHLHVNADAMPPLILPICAFPFLLKKKKILQIRPSKEGLRLLYYVVLKKK